MMNRILLLVASMLLAMVAAVPMAGAQNGGAPQDVEQVYELPAGAVFGSCDFPVRLVLSGKGKTIDLPGEGFIFTSPGLTATLTNVDTGKQAVFGVTGALHQSTRENGDVVTVATGRNLLGDPEAGFVLARGNFSYVFDAQGNLVQPLSGEGQLLDVCTLVD
jgi:hypothetical protein